MEGLALVKVLCRRDNRVGSPTRFKCLLSFSMLFLRYSRLTEKDRIESFDEPLLAVCLQHTRCSCCREAVLGVEKGRFFFPWNEPWMLSLVAVTYTGDVIYGTVDTDKFNPGWERQHLLFDSAREWTFRRAVHTAQPINELRCASSESLFSYSFLLGAIRWSKFPFVIS